MGEGIAREAGLQPVGRRRPGRGETGAADTRAAAEAMAAAGARLIVFAGGDGTARDMAAALGDRVPVIGVPAGVKMHSAVYATSPRAAADLALRALAQDIDARPREVMDIDEEAFRAGAVSAKLYGYLPVPYAPDLMQSIKAGGVSSDRAALSGIAAEIARPDGGRAALHPGARHHHAGDRRGARPAQDAAGSRPGAGRGGDCCRRRRGGHPARAGGEPDPAGSWSRPSAGRGIFSGRGNQQIGARVVRAMGLDRLLVAATPEKLASLHDSTLHVDTGDPDLDRALAGWRRVITGRGNETVCRVAA